MPISELIPAFVETMPDTLEPGVLYISLKYEVAIHLCACGWCGQKTVTPFDARYGWVLTQKDSLVTLSPSIGNFQMPCRSHYWIRDNQVVWV